MHDLKFALRSFFRTPGTSALIVIEPKSSAAKLFFQHPILFAEIVYSEPLPVVYPSGHGDQQEPEWIENFLRLQSPLSSAQRPQAKRFRRRRLNEFENLDATTWFQSLTRQKRKHALEPQTAAA